MSDNLEKHFPKLELISKVKCKKARRIILKDFCQDPTFCKAVREIVKNTINRNVKLSENDKSKLRKHRTILLGIVNKKRNKKRTKELVQQIGSGLFLPIGIPAVASLLYDALKGR